MAKTVLVTGATGFLGSHLVKKLVQEGHTVLLLKRSFSDTTRIKEILSKVICYDIDQCELFKPFQEFRPIDVIIHAATCYGRNNQPLSTLIEANVMFPLRLLDLASEFNSPSFINTDTYFNTDKIVYQYLNGYSLSKKHFGEWGRQFAESKKNRFINAKLHHSFGANDHDSKFTTYIIKSCLKNSKRLELTPGEQKRDFIHIDDVVSAYLVLLDKATEEAEWYQNYDLGYGKAISIREFVETVHSITQSKTILKFGALPYREGEMMYTQADIQPITELGWKPEANLEKRLIQTIEAERLAMNRK